MLSIVVPPAQVEQVGFQPESEYRRLLAPGTAPPLFEKLSMTPPVVVGLRPEQATSDPRIAAFLAAQAGETKFSLVQFKVGFAPAEDEPITMAVVEVSLETGGAPVSPFVTDMTPDKIVDPSDLTRDLEGKIDLEIFGQKIGFSLKHSTQRPAGELFLVAAGIGKPRVGWEINETGSMKIGGTLVFNLILQAPSGQPTAGRVAVTARVRRKKLGIIPYRALLDDTPTGQFTF